ncbi:putative Ig domain-containing protein [Myxococcota bacterium]|nr:putative Ig domain-containing protein [Myxococcota bacterium]
MASLRSRAALSLVFACSLAAKTAGAQTPYIVTDSVGTYTEITGGTVHVPVPYGFFNAWDEGYAPISLPFPFTWFGNTYNTIYAYTNGFVSFAQPPLNAGLLGAPTVVPSPANTMHDFIGVMWSDLDGPAGAEISSRVSGAAGARTFTIQYRNLRDFGNSLSSVNFQVQLDEGTSAARVVMGPNNGVTGASTVIENVNGTDGRNLLAPTPTCGVGCSCAPGACGSQYWQPTGRTFTITLPQGPELAGEIDGPAGAYPGTTFDATIRIRNLGLTATGSFQYQVRLASSRTSTAGAPLLATVTVPDLLASSTLEETIALVMPPGTAVGTFFLALTLDTTYAVEETLETNNLAVDAEGIATAPDLRGSVLTQSTSGPGEPLEVTLTVESFGAPVVAPIPVSFVLSTDLVRDAGDLPLGSGSITLGDGFEGSEVFDLTVPLGALPSPPVYYVLAEIDDQGTVPEIDEQNNVATSQVGGITLTGPDLAATTITAPPFLFRGLPYPIVTTIRNGGGATARDFTVCVVISRNLLISVVSDPVLLETGPLTLAPGESTSIQLAPVVPVGTSSGAYYLASVADCALLVPETLETNNTARRSDQVVVRDPVPDFSPVEVATATAAAAGETIPVSVRLANLGNAPGSATLRLVLSTNAGITIDDTTIWESSPIVLAAGAEETISVWAPLPGDLASGGYHVGAIVDPEALVEEVYEDNNAAGVGPFAVTGSDLAIITPPVPPAIIGVPYVRRFAAVGGAGDYAWSLTWDSGSAPAGLSFDAASAELTGSPDASASGRHGFTLRVTSGGLSAVRTYSLVITPPTIPLSIVSSRLPPALSLETYTQQLIAVGGTPPYVWSLAGDAPPGLGLSADGELGGEPQLVGAYTFRVNVEDVAGTRVAATLAVDVLDRNTSITITTADIARADLGMPYEAVFTVEGGTAPYAWRFEPDEEIPGLAFDVGAATLTGTPTVAGDYPFVVEVRDSKGLIDRNAYVLRVLPPGELLITTGQDPTSELPTGKVAEPYVADDGTQVRLRAVRRAGGDPGAITWMVVDGSIPPGVTIDATGLVAGTPSEAGVYAFRVLATTRDGDYAYAALFIEIAPKDEEPTVVTEDDGCACTASERRGPDGASLVILALLGVALGARRVRRARASVHVAGVALVIVLALGVVLAPAAEAQIVPYQVVESTAPYLPLINGTEVLPGLGDGATARIPLPFDFYLYGEPTSALWVNANGLVANNDIRNGHHFPPISNPSTAPLAKGWVAPLWDDLCSSAGCSGPNVPGIGVFYEIDTTPGAGRITIEWRHVRHFSDSSVASDLSFQVTLHEGLASMVELHYGPMTQGADFFGTPTSYDARIGVMDSAGVNGMWLGPCSGAVPCSFPQLDALTGQKITIVADAGEDVTVTSVSVPEVGYPGLPMPVAARVLSRHRNPLGPISAAAYLVSSTATSTAGASLVWTSAPFSLTPFESHVLAFDAEIPESLPVGQYRVVVVADHLGALAETDETNNAAASLATVRIADRAPDFRVSSVRPLATEVRPGDGLDVEYVLENAGNLPGRLVAQAYLSRNPAISTSDVPVGAPIVVDTTARELVGGTLSFTVPATLGTGEYHVGFITDPDLAIAELTEANNVGRAAEVVVVSSTTVEILTEALPPATLGLAYSAAIRAAGGTGSFTYRLASGALPRGMNFNASTAEVFGIPLEAGAFTLELQALSGVRSARKSFTLDVVDPTLPLTLLASQLPIAIAGQDYAVSVGVIGGRAPYTWRIASGAPPSGILLGTDGTLFGTPRATGFATFEVEVRDAESNVATTRLSIEVRAPANLTVLSTVLPEARVGQPYTQALFASGGIGELTWTVLETNLLDEIPPPGLVVGLDGVIAGIPEVVGPRRFRVEARDAAGNVDTNVVSIDVVSLVPFGVATRALPEGQPDVAYRALVRAEGGQAPYTWEVLQREGSLPPGFSAAASQGIAEGETTDDLVISGTPPAIGTWAFTVRVRDAQGRSADHPLALVVREPPPPPMTTSDGGCTCVAAPGHGASTFLLALCIAGLVISRRARRP